MNLHHTVMRDEAIAALAIKPTGTYIDGTLGAGGHARAIISALGKGNTFVGLDADETALAAFTAAGHPKTSAPVHLVNENFRAVADIAARFAPAPVAGILVDLGWRMEQFTDSGKGFSFNAEEPLYMTYGNPEEYLFTAHDIVNSWEEENIANVIYGYGGERRSRAIAKAIVTRRKERPITTAKELGDLVAEVIRARGKIHPATRTFQALRIAVNDELGVLEEFITNAFTVLAPQGRLAIITFHSLEDRIVKHRFRSLALDGAGTLLTKKPIVASREEIISNPRARSAKLRVIEKS